MPSESFIVCTLTRGEDKKATIDVDDSVVRLDREMIVADDGWKSANDPVGEWKGGRPPAMRTGEQDGTGAVGSTG